MRYKMKLVVVGDAGVGKTALLFAFTLGSAPVSYVPTVFDTLSKGMTVDGYTVDVGLWDTGRWRNIECSVSDGCMSSCLLKVLVSVFDML